jgi:hypothetical protein
VFVSVSTTTIYCGHSCLNRSWIDPTGVIASWPFDDSYADKANAYHAVPSKSLPSFGPGYIGQAAIFDASAKQAIYTSFIPLHEVSFTVETWIKPTGYPNPTDDSIVGLCPSQIEDYCLHINLRDRKLYFGFYYNDVEGETPIILDRWIHTAFTFDAATLTLTIYLDGVADGHAKVTSPLKISSGNFTIGTNEGVALPDNYFQVEQINEL